MDLKQAEIRVTYSWWNFRWLFNFNLPSMWVKSWPPSWVLTPHFAGFQGAQQILLEAGRTWHPLGESTSWVWLLKNSSWMTCPAPDSQFCPWLEWSPGLASGHSAFLSFWHELKSVIIMGCSETWLEPPGRGGIGRVTSTPVLTWKAQPLELRGPCRTC